MYLLATITLCFCVTSCYGVSTRIQFSRCNFGGFSCIVTNSKYAITFECPPTIQDATFFLWQFTSPQTTDQVILKNCETLRLNFACTNENKPITTLHVSNITNLMILTPNVLPHNPPVIIFENITKWDYIPPNTFSQIINKTYHPGCIKPTRDLQNLTFHRVNIGIVASGAFASLEQMVRFQWDQVRVDRIQQSAIQINLQKEGNFSIINSNIEVLEHLAFRITATEALFAFNNLVEMGSSAINGSIGQFRFLRNTVNEIQSYAISLLSQHVQINNNRFEYVRSSAFERISPGLLQHSSRSFGSLRFTYTFNLNLVNFMDAASLHPHTAAYDNVNSDLKMERNLFFCTCENLGWLLGNTGHGYNTDLMKAFYETIIDEEYYNHCLFTSCSLLLKKTTGLVKNGYCVENITAESLCEKKIEIDTRKGNTKPTTVYNNGTPFYGLSIILFNFVVLVLFHF